MLEHLPSEDSLKSCKEEKSNVQDGSCKDYSNGPSLEQNKWKHIFLKNKR